MTTEKIRKLVEKLQVHGRALEKKEQEVRRDRQELKVARERYATLFDLSPLGYTVLDEQGSIREANLTLCHLLGNTRKKILKQSFESFVGPDDKGNYRSFLEGLKKKAEIQTSEVMTLGYRKRSRRVRLQGCRIILDDSSIAEGLYQITVEDVTETERREATREKQRALFEQVVEGMTDAIVTTNEDQRIVLFNRGAEVMFGCPASAAMGQCLDRFIPERFRSEHRLSFRQFSEGGVSSRQMGIARNVMGLRANGEEFPAEVTISKVEVREGAKIKKLFAAVIRDVTERREILEALDKERKFFSTLFDTTAGLLVLTDAQGNIVRFNPACEKLTGFSCEEVVGRPWWEKLLPPGDPEEVQKYFHALVQGWVPLHNQNYWMTKDGTLHWIAWSNALIRKENGEVEFVIGTGIDMTENKNSQQLIAGLAKQNESILQSTKEGIYGIDREWHATFFNHSAENLTGWNSSDILGKCPHEFLHHTKFDGSSYRREECPLWWTLLQGTSHSIDTEVLWRKDGTSFPAEYATTPIRNEAGEVEGAVVTFRDITQRKETEAALRDNRLMLERQQAELRSFTAKLLNAQEEERRRISLDLHDDVNQRLALISLKLQAAQQSMPKFGPNVPVLQEVYEDVGTLSDDIRRLAHQYHPPSLQDLGLEATLRSLAGEISKWEKLPVKLTIRHVPKNLPFETAICIYRVAQECFHNIVKHSKATSVQFELLGEALGLKLVIRDNGVGFEKNQAPAGELGLLSLKERARLVKGRFLVTSAPGKGTKVSLWVPYEREGG